MRRPSEVTEALDALEEGLEELDFVLQEDDPSLLNMSRVEQLRQQLDEAKSTIEGLSWKNAAVVRDLEAIQDTRTLTKELEKLRLFADRIKDLFDLGWEVRNEDVPFIIAGKLQELLHAPEGEFTPEEGDR